MGKSKKSSVRLPSDDGMTDDLREAIRAKHRLVEQMKEDVKDGDRDGKGDGSGREPKRSLVWKIVVIIGIVVWILTMLGGASAAEKATRAMRARYAQRRALENEERTKWRSERILRHFGLRRLSQLRHTECGAHRRRPVCRRAGPGHALPGCSGVAHHADRDAGPKTEARVWIAYVDVPVASTIGGDEPVRKRRRTGRSRRFYGRSWTRARTKACGCLSETRAWSCR